MKISLVNIYNTYLQNRNNLDQYFLKELEKLSSKILQDNQDITILNLNSLIELINPTINQKSLNKTINSLNIGKDSKKELRCFINAYYKERHKLYKSLKKAEEAIIIAYFC